MCVSIYCKGGNKTFTKHSPDYDKDIEGLSVSYSDLTYIGSGSNRVGSITVTLTFTFFDGTTVTETEIFSNINATTSKDFNYTIGDYDVTVTVTVTVEGKNNNMNITGVAAEITSKVANQ